MPRSRIFTHVFRILLLSLLALLGELAMAKNYEATVVIRNHLFEPSTLTVPAHKKIKLIIINEDSDPEEFDSFSLNREKVVFGNAKASVYIGPLEPGEYPFFGQYNPTSARGKIIVVEKSEVPHAN